ncbi:hypothetical protein TNCV_11671 [Trichonephila clavipes]|nr:hypothetical protein TNCV_11671 [Trichonephila clavipes]
MLRRNYTSDDPGDPPMGVDRRESVSLLRTNDGFLFDVDDSEEESRQLVWKYAYPHKSWQLDPKSFDKLLATEYGCYPFLQLKTVKATVLIDLNGT